MLPAAASLLMRLLWPARCVACRALVAEGEAFCPECAISVSPLGAACRGCAVELAAPETLCRPCLERPLPFREARACLLYGGATADAVIHFKHGRRLAAARPLGRLLAPLAGWAA